MSDGTEPRRYAPWGDPTLAPGGPTALTRGCTCSVLANAAYRAGAPGESVFVDTRCPVHSP